MVDAAVFSIFHRRTPNSTPRQQPVPGFGRDIEPIDLPTPDSLPGMTAAAPTAPAISTAAPIQPVADQDTASIMTGHELAWLNLPVGHAFIGLANPAVWTVTASFGSVYPFEITPDITGLYRPADFRPAPWSGFAYDVAPDRRTGLVAGTRILTARGEIAVEDLLPGDAAMALRGPALLPILWIGRCIADEPPILIEAGALGDQRPSRPLYVAADHPIFVDPVPVPARRLVNGTTIQQTDTAAAELFHIDVGNHEVLFAQNLALASTQRPTAEPSQ